MAPDLLVLRARIHSTLSPDCSYPSEHNETFTFHLMNSPELQQKAFLLLLIVISLAFGWILLPFFGAIFWGFVLAIIFVPFYRWLLERLGQRQNLAALTTLLI